ncbi:MAG: DegT/DnrJ/EryC1/StrS family aminotransferase [Candidatus Rokubacteria bacterium]|nr:DegT/DnrJ/EryC1/StrS family aminotransferase [Candidatus Rokubacteria bacterium]
MIPFVDLARQHAALKPALMQSLERVLDSSRFILGEQGAALERELAAVMGVRHGIGVASGTDALRLALAALRVGPGDEVITPAFSFVASTTTIVMTGATPVFVDVDPATYALDPAAVERAITPRTRAVVPVHLYGHPAPMDAIVDLARARGIAVVEDAAQAIGASYAGRPVGSWGDVACLSFYPTKNLGACGDGGMVVTDRDDLAERVRRLRHHGDAGRYRHAELGWCSRLDEMQAALLHVKLAHLGAWTDRRRAIAGVYAARLGGLPLGLAVERAPARHVYHLYTVRHPQRDALQTMLADLGIGTAVHYPIPVPAQPLFGIDGERRWPEAWRAAREVLSLPCFAELTDGEVERVAAAVREACARLR